MLCNGSVMFFVVLTIFLSFCFPLTCLSFFGFYLLVNILWAGRGRRSWVRKVPVVLPLKGISLSPPLRADKIASIFFSFQSHWVLVQSPFHLDLPSKPILSILKFWDVSDLMKLFSFQMLNAYVFACSEVLRLWAFFQLV